MSENEIIELQKKSYKYDQLEIGWRYQDFISRRLYEIGLVCIPHQSRDYQLKYGESFNGIEIKFDRQLKDTGNIYIEIESKSSYYKDKWCPSGAFSEDNSYLYVIGNYEVAYLFAKNQLRDLFNRKKDKIKVVETQNSKGFLLHADFLENSPLVIKKLVFKGKKNETSITNN